ncbi:MAG: hypothetical protein QM778_09830 [Myxococcales bacterium]
MLILRRALLGLWLLVPISACNDDHHHSGGVDDDAGDDGHPMTHADGGWGDGDGDGDGDLQGGDGDAGQDAGGQSDAGDAAGPVAFHCETPDVNVQPGQTIPSDDGFAGVMFPNPSAGAALRLCQVPADQVPAEVAADHHRGKVYFLESLGAPLGSGLFAAAPDAAFTPQGADGAVVAPALIRVFVPGELPANALGARFEFSPQVGQWLALSQLDAAGAYLYLRHLDGAEPRYEVSFEFPAQDRYYTGEVFDFGSKITVNGQPSTQRTLALVSQGCNLEPIQPVGDALPVEVADECETRSVMRTGAELDSDYADSVLSEGRVFDLTTAQAAATHLPSRFFCDFPGSAQATVNLLFKNGDTTELLVDATRLVGCALSLDRVSAVDTLEGGSNGRGPLGILDFAVSADGMRAEAFVSTDAALAEFTPVGSGTYREDDGPLASQGPFSEVELASSGLSANAISLSFDTDHYEASAPVSQDQGFYDLGSTPTGLLTASFAGDLQREVVAPNFTELELAFGVPNGAETTFSFADGAADLVVVRGLSVDQSGGRHLVFERWLRPALLPLVEKRRQAQIFSSAEFAAGFDDAQAAAAKAAAFLGPVAEVTLEFFNVRWDEERTLWPGERVLPVLAGYAVTLPGSAIEPCPSQVVKLSSGCSMGPHHVLLAATKNGIEAFDPSSGERLGSVLSEAGSSFKQVVQLEGCLLASQQKTGEEGLYLYPSTADGLDEPVAMVTSAELADQNFPFLANGLGLFPDGSVLVANGLGPVVQIGDDLGLYTADTSTRGFGLAVEEHTGLVVVSNQAADDGQQTLLAIQPDDPAKPSELPLGLSQPEQLSFAATPMGSVLGVVEAGAKRLTQFSDAGKVQIDFATGAPRGVYPLLTPGKWLVIGTGGLGAQVVDFNGDEPTATPSGALGTQDFQYLSSACLPFAPTP